MTSINKAEIARIAATQVGVSNGTAEAILVAALDTITRSLSQGKEVRLSNFGKFSVRTSLARTGRNINSGENVTIPPSTRVKFSASTNLKGAVKAPVED